MTHNYIINAKLYISHISGPKESAVYFMTTKNYLNNDDLRSLVSKIDDELSSESTDPENAQLPFSYQKDGMNLDTLMRSIAYRIEGNVESLDEVKLKRPILIDDFLEFTVRT